MRQQVDAPLLAAALHLDPRAPQDLLDQGQAQPQPGAQDHDPERLAQVEAIGQGDAQPLEQEAADEPAQAAADQAVDQALARPVGQPLPQADPQPQHRPRQCPAQQAAAQEADHHLAGHQAERAAQRRRRRAPGHGAGQLEPGTVAERTVGVQENPQRAADQEPGQGVANVNRLGLDQLDIQVKPEERTQAADKRQVVGLAQVGPAGPDRQRRRGKRRCGLGAGEIGPGNVARLMTRRAGRALPRR